MPPLPASRELSELPSMVLGPATPINSLLDDLRSRVNQNGYVQGSTYQYRVTH